MQMGAVFSTGLLRDVLIYSVCLLLDRLEDAIKESGGRMGSAQSEKPS